MCKYSWQASNIIDHSTDPFLDNIKSPIMFMRMNYQLWRMDVLLCQSLSYLVPLLLVMG
jgi:hypothetical protein